MTPRLPKNWKSYKIHYRHRQTIYHITISRLTAGTGDANQLFLDGTKLMTETLPLVDDRREHSVEFKVWTPVRVPEDHGALLTAV